jgi:hypothetical protein
MDAFARQLQAAQQLERDYVYARQTVRLDELQKEQKHVARQMLRSILLKYKDAAQQTPCMLSIEFTSAVSEILNQNN